MEVMSDASVNFNPTGTVSNDVFNELQDISTPSTSSTLETQHSGPKTKYIRGCRCTVEDKVIF